mmetsp:Transcript_25554/g.101874  ORF Transcript_25554/g.101874 Transcript_25554/m.101874 type:complete len:93 (+) Transcript_25554:1091-1369(+)
MNADLHMQPANRFRADVLLNHLATDPACFDAADPTSHGRPPSMRSTAPLNHSSSSSSETPPVSEARDELLLNETTSDADDGGRGHHPRRACS